MIIVTVPSGKVLQASAQTFEIGASAYVGEDGKLTSDPNGPIVLTVVGGAAYLIDGAAAPFPSLVYLSAQGTISTTPNGRAIDTLGALASPNNRTIPEMVQGWWSDPVVYRKTDDLGDHTFIGGADQWGGLIVALYDHNTGDIRRRNIAQWEIDDHNVPAFSVRLDGRIIVAYARHAEDNLIRYRISQTANLDDWGDEQTLATSDTATYVQIFRQSASIHLFYRVGASGSGGWAHRRSTNNGITWTAEVIIADTEYCIIVPSADEFSFRIFSYENPTSGTDHDIYYMLMNSTSGSLTKPGGVTLGNAFTATNTPIAPASMQKAVDVDSATISTRLMAAAKSSSPTCLAVEFTSASTTDGKLYRYVYASSGALFTRKYICDVGVPFATATQYHGGACFGDDTNTVYAARNTGEGTAWTLDKYITEDAGNTWAKTTLLMDSDIIARPALFGSDKLLVSQFSDYVSYEDFEGAAMRIVDRG